MQYLLFWPKLGEPSTIEEFECLVYGKLGWDEKKFFESSISFVMKSLKGFNDLELERDKREWERLRILGSWVLGPHAKKGVHLTPRSLLPLPWDKNNWREDNKEILEQCDQIIAKVNART